MGQTLMHTPQHTITVGDERWHDRISQKEVINILSDMFKFFGRFNTNFFFFAT